MERDILPWRPRNVVAIPLSEPPFRRYLLYALSETFMLGLASPFFWLVGLEVLAIGNFWSNFYIMIVPMVITALTLPLWGGICDRFGSKPPLILGTLMSSAFPACWLFATQQHYHALLAVAAVVAGAFAGAVLSADLSMLFALTPRRNRSAYIAMLSVASSLGWAIGPALGGAIAQSLKPVEFHAIGRTFGNLHVLILISVVVRILHTLFIIPRVPEEPKESTGALVKHLLLWPFHQLANLLHAASAFPLPDRLHGRKRTARSDGEGGGPP